MGIHGDKSQQERDWVLNGENDMMGTWLSDAPFPLYNTALLAIGA